MEQNARRKERLEGFEIADNSRERLLKSQIIIFLESVNVWLSTNLKCTSSLWFKVYFPLAVITKSPNVSLEWHVEMLFTFVLIQTKDFWIIFMLSVSFWSIYTIYSGIWTRSNLIEFVLCITTDSAVVAQVFSCYQGRQGWNWCQRKIFSFFFLSSVSQACLSYAVFVCSFKNSLLPRKPELVSSTLPVVVKLRSLAFVDCSCFFSYPSQCWRSTAFDRKTPACLDEGRQRDSIEKITCRQSLNTDACSGARERKQATVMRHHRLFKHRWTLTTRATCETPPFTPAMSTRDPSFRFYGRAEVTLSPLMFHRNIRGCQGCVLRKLPWSYVYGSLLDFLAKHTKQNILHS